MLQCLIIDKNFLKFHSKFQSAKFPSNFPGIHNSDETLGEYLVTLFALLHGMLIYFKSVPNQCEQMLICLLKFMEK